jgi:signal transduction histidine kinase
VSSLNFLLESVADKKTDTPNSSKLKHSKFLSSEIVEEIESYRALLAAEKGDLEIGNELVNSYDIIWNTVNNIAYHTVAHGKNIEVSEDAIRFDFNSDPIVLGRILMNMLKNALEATTSGGTVKTSCELNENNLIFWVQNQDEMSKEAKSHVFERQYSTKGTHRGIGTYSMRLLGEEYLGGDVNFRSDEKEGTTFYFSLPVLTPET